MAFNGAFMAMSKVKFGGKKLKLGRNPFGMKAAYFFMRLTLCKMG